MRVWQAVIQTKGGETVIETAEENSWMMTEEVMREFFQALHPEGYLVSLVEVA